MKSLEQLLDPVHIAFDLFGDPFCREIWAKRYKAEGDVDILSTFSRVANAIHAESPENERQLAFEAMRLGLFMPAGRILASAGLKTGSTLQNCYVSRTVEDSVEGIMQAYGESMITLGRFGGIGIDFTPIRPKGARVGSQGLISPGVVHWMKMWHEGADRIKQAGHRRGAMMGTIADHHPDILDFIKAKQTKGELTNFNVSILISDDFMQAVKDDKDWCLGHPKPSTEPTPVRGMVNIGGQACWVYKIMKARELWDEIMQSTHKFSEPGVIFIDQVNKANNLFYCEDIRCTNPCVSGDTLILTDMGYVPIKSRVGLCTPIWNGHEWSDVEPYSTGVNQLFRVRLSNGSIVRTTSYHKWLMRTGSRIQTKDLKAGQELDVHEFPVIDDFSNVKYAIDAYSQGFYSGDGTKNSNYSNLYKHNEGIRNRLIGKMYDRNCESQPGHRWVHGPMLAKDFVPSNGTVEYRVNWLAGLLDADGNIARPSKDAMPVIQLNAKNRAFLEKVRMMLTTLGVNARFWERQDAGMKLGSNGKSYMCESTACLMISGKGSYLLTLLGMKTERLDMSWVRKPMGKANVGVKIVSVAPDVIEETFCLTEPKRNTFIANGVLTSNCGEQPLPPHGACNLGHINLSRMVRKPFTKEATVNWELLRQTTRLAVRFLDKVIDVSNFPLEEQAIEQQQKRRIGLGVSGLADMLLQLGMEYGSPDAIVSTETAMRTIAVIAYQESVDLACTLGPFPLYNERYGTDGFANRMKLAQYLRLDPKEGIRNSLLLTVAPTGTVSTVFGNISSGIEPVYAFRMNRKVWVENNRYEEHINESFISRFYKHVQNNPKADINELAIAVTATQVKPYKHILMQATVQRWIDASVTKTVNCDPNISYEQFKDIYRLAYESGCKGCTTYVPSDIRGSVIDSADEPSKSDETLASTEIPDTSTSIGADTPTPAALPMTTPMHSRRPEVLAGCTYKIKWPHHNDNIYLTVNESDGRPYEVFIASMDLRNIEWIVLACIMLSRELRRDSDPLEVAALFKKIQGASEGAMIGKKYYTSLVSYIGEILEQHFLKYQGAGGEKESNHLGTVGMRQGSGLGDNDTTDTLVRADLADITLRMISWLLCPKCKQGELIKQEGCEKCTSCDYSKCG